MCVTRIGQQQVAIVRVDLSIVEDSLSAAQALAAYQAIFPRGTATVLLGYSEARDVTQQYFGSPVLVAALVEIDPRRFQWRRYRRR